MEKQKRYTAEEKQNIVSESKTNGRKKDILDKYGITYKTLAKWEKEFQKFGLDGLDRKKKKTKNVDRIVELEKELKFTEEKLKDTEIELEIRKKLMKEKSSLSLKERIVIVEQYIGKGIKRSALLGICEVTEYQWKKHNKINKLQP